MWRYRLKVWADEISGVYPSNRPLPRCRSRTILSITTAQLLICSYRPNLIEETKALNNEYTIPLNSTAVASVVKRRDSSSVQRHHPHIAGCILHELPYLGSVIYVLSPLPGLNGREVLVQKPASSNPLCFLGIHCDLMSA